jgi:arylsulfatase A-like enzyme
MDIFSTTCEAAGITPPQGIDGVSFLPALMGKDGSSPKRDMYFVRREGGKKYEGNTIQALRHEDWKILQNIPEAAPELYNLRSDPQESNNLAKKENQNFGMLSNALSRQMLIGSQIPWKNPHPWQRTQTMPKPE